MPFKLFAHGDRPHTERRSVLRRARAAWLCLGLLATGGEPALADHPPAEAPFGSRVQQWYQAGHFVSIRGLEVYYQTLGEGPPLLIIHGYPYSSYDFHRILPSLAREHRVILFDLPGMGFSAKPRDHDYSFAEYAQVVNELLTHLNIREVDLLTHDLGVSVAQELLARSADNHFRIRSVAFMNGGLFTDVYRPRLIQRILSQSPSWFGGFISRHLSRGMIEGSVLPLFGARTRPSTELLDDWWEILDYRDGRSIAHLIGRLVFEKERHQTRWIAAMQGTSIPLAYLCGPADPNSGTHMAARFGQVLPDAKVYHLGAEIGHWPQLEAPEEVLQAYRSFRSAADAVATTGP